MSGFRAVIPARLGSTRLPGKALADVGGKPMVVRVAEQAARSGADEVWVATDAEEIAAAARAHGFRAVLTGEAASGTDRVARLAALAGFADGDVVVNVQGDEPLIDPHTIRQVARAVAEGRAPMATAAYALADAAQFASPHVVKVVCDRQNGALYFSRAPLPFARDGVLPPGAALGHVGLYAYRVDFLRRFAALPPAPVEQWEALEQLRALWHGERIHVVRTAAPPAPGVDTPEDLARVQALWAARGVP